MEIMVKRRFLGDKYTIGSLFVNGERFRVDGKAVDTLEDKNRDANMNGHFDSRRQYARRHIGMPFGWFQHHQGRIDTIVARVQTVVCRNRCGNGQRRKGIN